MQLVISKIDSLMGVQACVISSVYNVDISGPDEWCALNKVMF